MNHLLRILVVLALLATNTFAAGEPDSAAQKIFQQLMSATIANNYDAFVEVCDSGMKAALSKQMLQGVSEQVAPRAKQGYDSEYLGALNQHGFVVHLWRLRFKDAGDDVLATLSVKDEKAGGFYLR